jgi:hypothetical protein
VKKPAWFTAWRAASFIASGLRATSTFKTDFSSAQSIQSCNSGGGIAGLLTLW